MRVRSEYADEAEEQVQSKDPAVRYADFISEEVVKIVQVTVGTNPQEPLDKFALAQDRVAELRRRATRTEAEVAQLKARYWGNGANPSQFDLERKRLLAELDIAERDRANLAGEKLTEPKVDAAIHAHPRYVALVEKAANDRAVLASKLVSLREAEDDVAAALGAVAYYEKAVRLAEEFLRFGRRTHDATH